MRFGALTIIYIFNMNNWPYVSLSQTPKYSLSAMFIFIHIIINYDHFQYHHTLWAALIKILNSKRLKTCAIKYARGLGKSRSSKRESRSIENWNFRTQGIMWGWFLGFSMDKNTCTIIHSNTLTRQDYDQLNLKWIDIPCICKYWKFQGTKNKQKRFMGKITPSSSTK